jgi:hypothetical protein
MDHEPSWFGHGVLSSSNSEVDDEVTVHGAINDTSVEIHQDWPLQFAWASKPPFKSEACAFWPFEQVRGVGRGGGGAEYVGGGVGGAAITDGTGGAAYDGGGSGAA